MSEHAASIVSLERPKVSAEAGAELSDIEVLARFDSIIKDIDTLPSVVESQLETTQRMPKELGATDMYGKYRAP